jgi:pimeloyl-ACP methyl ester carboxylesterase
MEAFFFGSNSEQVFATYHPPVRGDSEILTVICPPLFWDYMRTELALRELAISLAERGQHVLRLDYRGTGDSFGDLSEVTVSDWVQDIRMAMQEGRDLTGSRVVRLVGVRAGALLACAAARGLNAVQRLVLWDPVSDGVSYLRALQCIQMKLCEQNLYLSRAERDEAMKEYAGFNVSRRMLEEFLLLNASIYSSVSKCKLHVVSTSSHSEFPVPEVSHDLAPFRSGWDTLANEILMPRPVLERLIICLTKS